MESSITQEIKRLQRENRIFKVLFLLLVGSVGLWALQGQRGAYAEPKVQDTIWARGLVIIDKKDRVRFVLRATPEATTLTMQAPAPGNGQINLVQRGKDGGNSFEMKGEKSNSFSVQNGEFETNTLGTCVRVSDASGRPRVALKAADDFGRINVYATDLIPSVIISESKGVGKVEVNPYKKAAKETGKK